jgi:peptide deformylase
MICHLVEPSGEVRFLVDEIIEHMRATGTTHASAPLIGVHDRVIVTCARPPDAVGDRPPEGLLVVVNPEIEAKDVLGHWYPLPEPGRRIPERLMPCEWRESCVLLRTRGSMPRWASVGVLRPAVVRVRGLDREGRPLESGEGWRILHGRAARDVQHEVDHLDGITVLDRIGRLKRKYLERELAR